MSANPPCAEWAIWKGGEVEGQTSLGEATLFIRRLPALSVSDCNDWSWLRAKSGCRRVWFCKEFTQWRIVKAVLPHFDEVCLEVEPKCLENVPKELRTHPRVKVYLKVAVELRAGDVICVGMAFSDEAFVVGQGRKVSPEMYLKDVKIL